MSRAMVRSVGLIAALLIASVCDIGAAVARGAAASITAAKRSKLTRTALQYLATLGRTPPCRFDAVLMRNGATGAGAGTESVIRSPASRRCPGFTGGRRPSMATRPSWISRWICDRERSGQARART